MMRDLASFVIFIAMMIGTAVSKPLWSTIIDNHDVYPTPEINAHYLAAYQHTRSPYYVYNIYTNAGGIPSTVHVSKPEISYVPSYNLYYGTPIYDFRIPLNPIYPMLTPSHPGVLPPALPPTSAQPSDDDDCDGIEKLDTKVDTVDTETKKPGNDEQDDDSITVEAI